MPRGGQIEIRANFGDFFYYFLEDFMNKWNFN